MPATKEKKVKSKLREEFDTATYLYWIKSMLLMRRFEEMAGRLYGQQKIRGFCHLYIGQEACISGAVSALREGPSIKMASPACKEKSPPTVTVTVAENN